VTAPRSPAGCTTPHGFSPSTLQQVAEFGYAKRDGFTAVTLPYLGGGLQFLILLPDEANGADGLAARLTPDILMGNANLNKRLVSLSLPKLRLQGPTMKLKELLRSLGMTTPFSGDANFSRMSADPLLIDQVYHKTFLELDEEGTEAAAATAVVMAPGGMSPRQPRPVVVRVDHPFLFAIQLRESGACLFLGRVTDPR